MGPGLGGEWPRHHSPNHKAATFPASPCDQPHHMEDRLLIHLPIDPNCLPLLVFLLGVCEVFVRAGPKCGAAVDREIALTWVLQTRVWWALDSIWFEFRQRGRA